MPVHALGYRAEVLIPSYLREAILRARREAEWDLAVMRLRPEPDMSGTDTYGEALEWAEFGSETSPEANYRNACAWHDNLLALRRSWMAWADKYNKENEE